MVTTTQTIMVAKDRVFDELIDVTEQAHGYWNLKGSQKKHVIHLLHLLLLPETPAKEYKVNVLTQLKDFINGDEEMFFTKEVWR